MRAWRLHRGDPNTATQKAQISQKDAENNRARFCVFCEICAYCVRLFALASFRCSQLRKDDENGKVRIHLDGMDADRTKGHEQATPFPEDEYPLQTLTHEIIASSFAVFRAFGYGFLESVYRRALAVELQYRGIPVGEEVRYELFHRGVSVGVYRADLVADSKVIVETKTGLVLAPVAPVQLLNCLCAARLSIGLVVHFGPRGAQVKRVVATDGRHASIV